MTFNALTCIPGTTCQVQPQPRNSSGKNLSSSYLPSWPPTAPSSKEVSSQGSHSAEGGDGGWGGQDRLRTSPRPWGLITRGAGSCPAFLKTPLLTPPWPSPFEPHTLVYRLSGWQPEVPWRPQVTTPHIHKSKRSQASSLSFYTACLRNLPSSVIHLGLLWTQRKEILSLVLTRPKVKILRSGF